MIYTALGTIFSVSVMFSQSQNWWRTNGNTPQSTDYLGTSNNSPLIIKTNNIERLRIAPNGFVGIANSNPQYVLDVGGRAKLRYNVYCDSLLQCSYLKVNNLSGSGNALVVTDAQGNINRLNYSGNNNDVLTGNGNWTNINALLPSPIWQSSGQNIFYNNGYVGIGTSNPLFSLDVVGDIRVSNNIYVGGGIVISDKVNAFTEVTAPKMVMSEAKATRLVSDSIMMDSTKAIYGNTLIQGDVKMATNADVMGDLRVNNKLTIQGNAKFNGLLTATQGLMFSDSIGMKWYSGGSNGAPSLIFGKTGVPPTPVNPNICITPYPLGQLPPNFQMWGLFQVLWNNTSLSLWADGANSLIESYGNGSLLLNYHCGKDVVVGSSGSGNLIVNNKLGIGTGNPQKQLHIQNVSGDAEALVYSASNNGKATVWVGNNALAYGFGIDANGKGHIYKDLNNPVSIMSFDMNHNAVGIDLYSGNLSSSQITNALSSYKLVVNGQILAVEYAAKNQVDWPDYVFERRNLSLDEVNKYIQQHKHLPGFESAAFYKTNGIKLTEIIIRQQEKIEEIFLHLIELKKENEQLKEEIQRLKNK
ncbi:MAG: bZIP transcription factor [Bacteroidota bacterium]